MKQTAIERRVAVHPMVPYSLGDVRRYGATPIERPQFAEKDSESSSVSKNGNPPKRRLTRKKGAPASRLKSRGRKG